MQRTLLATAATLFCFACEGERDPDVGSSTSTSPITGTTEDSTTSGGGSTLSTSGSSTSQVEPTTSSSSGGSLECNPPDELEFNDDEEGASVLPPITDDDSDGSSVDSILSGDLDQDWFVYKGVDVAFAYVDPSGILTSDKELRLCLFVDCLADQTPKPNCFNTSSNTSPEGRLGCCAQGMGAVVSIDLECPGGDDDAIVYMRIDQGYEDACVPYSLKYHY